MAKAQYERLSAAERQCGQKTYLLEKDTWVVATLSPVRGAVRTTSGVQGRHIAIRGNP